MWFVATVFAAVLLATFRLTTRYEYGPKSRRLLGLGLLGSIVPGYVLARWALFPEATGFHLVLGSAVVALVVFTFVALAVAEVLRKNQQRAYDEQLARLRSRAEALALELEASSRQLRSELRRANGVGDAFRGPGGALEDARRRVEAWKREGDSARIRSIKAEEWENELRALDAAGLGERREALERELAGETDLERRSRLEVLLALATIVAVDHGPAGASAEERRYQDSVFTAAERRRRLESELAAVRAEQADWQRRLREFLSKEIPLE